MFIAIILGVVLLIYSGNYFNTTNLVLPPITGKTILFIKDKYGNLIEFNGKRSATEDEILLYNAWVKLLGFACLSNN